MTRWVFVQARLGSTRLPGKVLKPIGGKSVIEHLHERLLFLRSLVADFKIAYLVPDNVENLNLSKFIEKMPDCEVYLGDEKNVLSRFGGAFKKFGPSKILRITADCPFVDPFALKKLVQIGDDRNLDYCFLGPTFAEGVNGDYFNAKTFQSVFYAENKKPEDLEHITPYFHRNKTLLNCLGLKNEIDESKFRIVLDSEQDYSALKELENHLKNLSIPEKYKFSTFKNIISQYPHIASINCDEIRNESFDVFSKYDLSR